jgi:hypothetical protein
LTTVNEAKIPNKQVIDTDPQPRAIDQQTIDNNQTKPTASCTADRKAHSEHRDRSAVALSNSNTTTDQRQNQAIAINQHIGAQRSITGPLRETADSNKPSRHHHPTADSNKPSRHQRSNAKTTIPSAQTAPSRRRTNSKHEYLLCFPSVQGPL